MKHIQIVFKSLTAIALVMMAMSCATNFQEQEDLAAAAGFKMITPTKPDQISLLTSLPAGKVTPITYNGKSYFVLPDAKNTRAYVGGDTEYQAYKKLRADKQLSNQNIAAPQMNQNASMHDWNAWGGWDNVNPMGYRQ